MTTSRDDKLTQTIEHLRDFSISLAQSLPLVRSIGYGLLVLAVFDLVDIFVPPHFMNPVWEFKTLGGLVERVPVPLIGLGLVFLGEQEERGFWEIFILKFLSWVALLLGLLFVLFVPLGVLNTVRIDQQNQEQVTVQVNQRMAQIQQVKDAVKKATTTSEMEQLLSRLDSQGRTPEIKDSQQLEEVKKRLSSFIVQGEEMMKTQVQTTLYSQRMSLLKNSVKWNLGALLSGVLFIYLWRATSWTRKLLPKR
ncbi:MAG TPA: hypothetical protein DCY88_26255 [Cyanobacteria bacterium UBA11372]|nr:hypothetical protein [Cyanobacteria bacterium UBA11372]